MTPNEVLKRFNEQAESLTDVPKPYLEAIKKQYQSALNDITKELRKLTDKIDGIDPKDTIQIQKELFKHNRLQNIQLRIKEILNNANKVSRSAVNQVVKNSLKEGYYSQGFAYYNAMQGAGININFGMFDPNVINASVLTGVNRKITGYIFKNKEDGAWIWDKVLKENHAKAYRRINNAITQGLIKGDGYNKTARMLKKELFPSKTPKFNLTSAIERIIRTESGKARSLGDLIAYDDFKKSADKLGIDVKRLWYSTVDNRVRDTHLSLHNQPENENGQWIVGGSPADAPRLSGNPAEDINCRCTTVKEIEGLESTYDESKVAKKLDKDKYEIWKRSQSKS